MDRMARTFYVVGTVWKIMTKHWKTTAIRDGHLVNLFTFTTERGIAIDLAAGEFGSLIQATRKCQPTPNHVNEYEDHLDLATGAFNQYAVRHGYEATSLYLVEVAGLPNGELKPHPVGGMKFGGSRLYSATVFEETIDETPKWARIPAGKKTLAKTVATQTGTV